MKTDLEIIKEAIAKTKKQLNPSIGGLVSPSAMMIHVFFEVLTKNISLLEQERNREEDKETTNPLDNFGQN